MNLFQLESKRLVYRPFNSSDFDDLYGILGNEVVCEYLPGDQPYTKEQVKRVLDRFISSFDLDKKDLHYIAIERNTRKVIGYCGCSYIREYDCNEIEYFLKPEYFGQGFATEMAFMMKKVAVELGLPMVVGLADIDNVPSQVILEKLGYVYQKEVDHWGLKLKLYHLNLESMNN